MASGLVAPEQLRPVSPLLQAEGLPRWAVEQGQSGVADPLVHLGVLDPWLPQGEMLAGLDTRIVDFSFGEPETMNRNTIETECVI